MNTLTPVALEHVAADLVRRGLPVDYAERATTELTDHHRDLVAELRANGIDNTAADAEAANRLGDSHALVRKTVREYQRRHWCGRWPLLSFILGPVLLVFFTWSAFTLVAYCICWPLEQMGFSPDLNSDGILSSAEYAESFAAHAICLFIAPAVSLLILAHFARRAAMGSVWLWLSTIVLSVFASCFWIGLASSMRANAPADQGLLMVGLPILKFAHDPLYVAQILLPLAIGTMVTLWMRQQSRNAERSVREFDVEGDGHEYAKCA